MALNCFNFKLLKQCYDTWSIGGPHNFESSIKALGTKLISAINNVKTILDDVKETQIIEMKVNLKTSHNDWNVVVLNLIFNSNI